MSLDLTRTSPELMIERINIDNELFGDDALTFAEVTMDLPFEVPPDADGRNCSVTLLSVPQVKYRADQTVYAKRFDAAEFFLSISSDPVRLKVMSAVTTRDLIARLNDLYHLAILPNEVRNDPIDWTKWIDEGGGCPHDIVFTESYIFTGTLSVLLGDEYPLLDIQMENHFPFRWEDGRVMTFDSQRKEVSDNE